MPGAVDPSGFQFWGRRFSTVAMSSSDYLGSGIKLDQYFDIEVGATGDLNNTEGAIELRKDLALAVAEYLTVGNGDRLPDEYDENITVPPSLNTGLIGEYISDGILSDVSILCSSVITLDPRVEEVTSIESTRGDDPDTVVVEATVRIVSAEEADFEFIIDVN